MSVPKHPILACTRGFLAQADVKLNSPESSSQAMNSQSVNVVVNPEPRVHYPPVNPYVPEANNTDKTDNDEQKTTSATATDDQDSYVHYPGNRETPVIVTRDATTAKATYEELQKLVTDKDLYITALLQLVDIYENNPLIVNKYVIADDVVLCRLITALTDADEVAITKTDYQPTCFGKKHEFSVIQKIIVTVGDNLYNLKYNYPEVVEFLDKHHVSIKFCI